MTDYSGSRWADKEFSDSYTSSADDIILERRKLIGIVKSFYGHYFGDRESVAVMDLGCGDGTVTHELMKEYRNIAPTLVDGSCDMLKKAQGLMASHKAGFIEASFQELLSGKMDLPNFDFIFSSLAIHHLDTMEKYDLYSYIKELLNPGGAFVNIDVVLPPETLEPWYLGFWRDWIEERRAEQGSDEVVDIPSSYKGNKDNKPDTLESQLSALDSLGFKDVDCYYKFGIFAVFGGMR